MTTISMKEVDPSMASDCMAAHCLNQHRSKGIVLQKVKNNHGYSGSSLLVLPLVGFLEKLEPGNGY